jgi:hypothetical protein
MNVGTDNEVIVRQAEEEADFRDALLLWLDEEEGDLRSLLYRGLDDAFQFAYGRGRSHLFDWLARLPDPAARLQALDTILRYREEEEPTFSLSELAIHTVTLKIVNTIIEFCKGPDKSLRGKIDELATL